MPSKIDIRLVYEALHDWVEASGKAQKRITEQQFTRIVKGASIASSVNAIDTLWCQFLFSDANVYKGNADNLGIVDLARLNAILNPHVLTHSLTHSLSHAEVRN